MNICCKIHIKFEIMEENKNNNNRFLKLRSTLISYITQFMQSIELEQKIKPIKNVKLFKSYLEVISSRKRIIKDLSKIKPEFKYNLTGHKSEICWASHLKEFRDDLIVTTGYDHLLMFWSLKDGSNVNSLLLENKIIRKLIYKGNINKDLLIIIDENSTSEVISLESLNILYKLNSSKLFFSKYLNNKDYKNIFGYLTQNTMILANYTDGKTIREISIPGINNYPYSIGFYLEKNDYYFLFSGKESLIFHNVKNNTNVSKSINFTIYAKKFLSNIVNEFNIIIIFDDNLSVLNLNSFEVKYIELRQAVSSFALIKSTHNVAFNQGDEIHIVNFFTLNKVQIFLNHSNSISRIINIKYFHNAIASCSWDGTVNLYDLTKNATTNFDHSKNVSCIVFVDVFSYKNKEYLVSCGSSMSRDIKIWQI